MLAKREGAAGSPGRTTPPSLRVPSRRRRRAAHHSRPGDTSPGEDAVESHGGGSPKGGLPKTQPGGAARRGGAHVAHEGAGVGWRASGLACGAGLRCAPMAV
jgi:hypothetical protein